MASSNGSTSTGKVGGKARAARFRKVLMYEEIGSPTMFPPGYHDYQRYSMKRWSSYERKNQQEWGRTNGLRKIAHQYKVIVQEMLRNNGL